MLLTRWPDDPRLRFGRATCDLDPVTEEGSKLGVYRHRLVFLNARAPQEMVPLSLRPLMALVEDTLDGEVDETRHRDEVSQRILAKILKSNLDPEENARVKKEATWESARQESRAAGKAEGQAEGARGAIADLCELLGIPLTAERVSHLAGLGLTALGAVRLHLKTHQAWPPGSA